ncbi:MAG: transporter, permease family protein, partial [Proteobacteria bacterium]|nr:transporter, permease family protein [Pseudomonadota bacterium]
MKPRSVPYTPLDRLTVDRLIRGIRTFAASPDGGRKAKWLFSFLIMGMVGINSLNVVNSYVGRDFITAIENRNMSGFVGWALVYVGVFALSTVVAVLYRFCEERLGILWREWLTSRLANHYLDNRAYYRLASAGEIANPDQRIADDIKAFTVTTLSFTLMFLNGTFTVVAFSGVLWTISPLLFVVAVLYAAGGSYLAVRLGRPLVGLNFDQFDKEANFRADLIHIRENAESVALLHRERRLRRRMLAHLSDLAGNFRKIIAVNRNLGFFTTGYNYLIQVIPALIVAPLFIRGEIEFGVITQAAMAFAAVISRVVSLGQAVEDADYAPAPYGEEGQASKVKQPESVITIREEEGTLAYEDLTLISPQSGQVLLQDLAVSIDKGTRLLIVGGNDAAKVALLRATAGIWDCGQGRIIRPPFKQIFFLPERPYMPPGTM